jgi:hypothetical protein
VTTDRNALADDLEQLGLNAIAGAVRKGTVDDKRIKRSLQRTRRKRLEAGDRDGAKAVNDVLAKYWGRGQ